MSFGNVFQLIRLTVQRVSCLLTFQNTRMRSSRTRWSQLRPSSPHLSLRLLQIGPWIKDQVNMFSLFPNTFAKLGEVKEAGILTLHACVCAKLLQSCPTLRLHGLYSPPGSSVHGILQARILEWVAISFYKGSSQPRDWTQVSSIAGWFFTIWAAREAQISNPCLSCLLH